MAMNAYPLEPGAKRPGTSLDAARAIAPHAHALRRRAFDVLLARGAGGATPDEIAATLGQSVLSVRPRLTELKELGLVRETDRRRKNESGHNATVLVAVTGQGEQGKLL